MAKAKNSKAKQVAINKRYLVEIAGMGGILMNKQPDMSIPKSQQTKQAKVDKTEQEYLNWRSKLYFTESLGVHIPAENIHQCLKDACKYWGAPVPNENKKTYTDIVKCAVTVEELTLGNGKPLAIDDPLIVPFGVNCNGNPSRGPGGGLVYKIRPMIRPWGGTFIMHVYDARLTEDVLTTILTYGGVFKGLCDWRPKFGRFELVRLEEINGSADNAR